MLTDVKVRNAKAGEKPYKLPDAGGLHLHVTPAGHRSWRWRYQKDGSEKLVVLGAYPEMSLRQAREARDDRRQKLRTGADPTAEPTPTATLKEVALDWHEANKSRWKPHHATDVLGSLERDIFPALGSIPIREVTAPAILDELRKVEKRGAIETAHSIRGRLSKIFAYAIGEGKATVNPPEMIRGAMRAVPKNGHRPAADTLENAQEVMRKTESIPAYPLTRLALRFLALTAVRPGEVAAAEWSEIDGNLWRIPAPRMKMDRDHLVPLSRQALEVLEAAQRLSRHSAYVFVSAHSIKKPLSENALNVMLRRAGLQGVHVPHGWRATFSTLMNDKYPPDRMVIDLMLAHAAKGEVEAAYNRAEHLDRRRELIQIWADMLMDGMAEARALMDLPRKSPNG